jgi:hypothetical protein
MTAPPVAPTTPNKRRITLVKQHIHAGIPHRAGDVIELDRDLADWLITEGAAIADSPVGTTEIVDQPSQSLQLKNPTRKEK